METEKDQIAWLKAKAKESMKKEEYTEAFIHLSHAINISPDSIDMLSDRCRCLAQSEQYNLAIEDAEAICKLAPNSGLGHLRMAEIFVATHNHDRGLQAFQQAFQCRDSNKDQCMEGINKCKREIAREKLDDKQFPYVGCAIGIIISSLILVLDYLSFREESYIAHPFLKLLLCIGIAVGFYWIAKFYRASIKRMRLQVLEPPPDLLQMMEGHLHQD